MSSKLGSVLGASILLLTAACDRNLYLGYDGTELASGQARVVLDASDQPLDASLEQAPLDAGGSAPELDSGMSAMSPVSASPVMSMPQAAQCRAPLTDCDGRADTGCETDLSSDSQHCGACDSACSTPDCVCDNGALALRCASGRADCDGDIKNGCETDLLTSGDHCGSCKHVCHTNGHDVVTSVCVAGQCEITCQPRVSPEADCDHDPDNGCETYLWFDAQNCGQCGNRCARCEAGTCML